MVITFALPLLLLHSHSFGPEILASNLKFLVGNAGVSATFEQLVWDCELANPTTVRKLILQEGWGVDLGTIWAPCSQQGNAKTLFLTVNYNLNCIVF